jgi:hypothetical protein
MSDTVMVKSPNGKTEEHTAANAADLIRNANWEKVGASKNGNDEKEVAKKEDVKKDVKKEVRKEVKKEVVKDSPKPAFKK